jgi:hypothetical protein
VGFSPGLPIPKAISNVTTGAGGSDKLKKSMMARDDISVLLARISTGSIINSVNGGQDDTVRRLENR